MTEWLCGRVGESGSVLAIDLDTSLIEGIDRPQLEVRKADVVTEDLGDELYDLVYVRHTLIHVVERDDVFSRLARSVRPGGWLALVESDFVTWMVDPDSPPETVEAFLMWEQRQEQMSEANGMSRELGRRLPRLLSDAGFEALDIHGRSNIVLPGTDRRRMWDLTHAQILDGYVQSGQLTSAQAAAEVNAWADPRYLQWSALDVYALGRRPGS